MGCGSSSTAVQTFKNPEENKNYHKQKAPSRQSSAAPSIKSQRSEKKEKPSRKSSASSRASVGSADSRRRRKGDEGSAINSASTRKTYTIPRPNSEVINDSTLVTPVHFPENDDNKQETDAVHFEPVNEIDEKKLEAKRHHEEIQKQTFLTGDPEHETYIENVKENHEEIAKRKEEKRSQINYEELEEEQINNLGPEPLSFPPDMEEARDVNAEYTVDDIVEHNSEVSGVDWFKYGKKVYSWKIMEPIIKDRINQFKDPDDVTYDLRHLPQFVYPIHLARKHKVSRKELAKVLSFCHVGNSIEVPREQKLSRMKQSAENVLEEENDSEYVRDYKNQLNRWLADYPMNKIANDPPDTETDPNELPFPLPADIKSDPTVLRMWSEAWETFDFQVPEEGAWDMMDPPTGNLGDTHEVFSNEVKMNHGIETLEPFEMTIDGDAAWFVIELDLFKNDQTTEHQDTVWKKRATRTNLNDPVWMKKRREELGNLLKKRYEERKINYPVEKYINFAEILEQHWEEFQNLCAKEFNPPVRKVRQTAEVKPINENNSRIDGEPSTDHKESDGNVLVLCDDSSDEKQINDERDNQEENILKLTNKENNENIVRSASRESFDGTCKRDSPRRNVRSAGSSVRSDRGGSPDKNERTASRESNQSRKSSRSSSKSDSSESGRRIGSKGSERSSDKGNRPGSSGSSRSSHKDGSEHGSNVEEKEVINTDNIVDRTNNVVEDQDQMPTLETNDSGLDLISNDQADIGNADSEKKDGDSLQMPEKTDNDVSQNTAKKETDDFFD